MKLWNHTSIKTASIQQVKSKSSNFTNDFLSRAIKLIDNNPFKQYSSDEPKQEYDVSSGFDTASVAGLRIVRHEDNSMFKNTNYNFKISSNKQNTLNSVEENMNGVIITYNINK